MKRLEAVSAAFFLFVAAGVILATGGLEFWSGISPGPRFMPLLIGSSTVLLSVLFALETARRNSAEPATWPKGDDAKRIILLVLSIGLFAMASVWLGLVVSAFCFVAGTLFFVLRQAVLPSLLTSVVTAGLIYSVFVVWLGLRLPVGVLGI